MAEVCVKCVCVKPKTTGSVI